MPHKKKRSQANDELEPEAPGKQPPPPPAEERAYAFASERRGEGSFHEDDDFGTDLSNIADAHSPYEPDPREVDMLTDRIFGSVLSKFGWERHDGRIEHVGEKKR
jgi:hypothetical protein